MQSKVGSNAGLIQCSIFKSDNALKAALSSRQSPILFAVTKSLTKKLADRKL